MTRWDLGILITALNTAALLYLILKVRRIDLNAQAIWAYLMRRGMAKALAGGLATKNSPVQIHSDGRALLSKLGPELRAFGAKHKRLSDDALALEIEKRFGERIMREVCVPNGLNDGECLYLATQVARGE